MLFVKEMPKKLHLNSKQSTRKLEVAKKAMFLIRGYKQAKLGKKQKPSKHKQK